MAKNTVSKSVASSKPVATVPTVPVPELFNVISVRCSVTGYRYVGVRAETIESFRKRVNAGAATMSSRMMLIQSVAQFGDETHSYRYIARDLTKADAKAQKFRSLRHDANKGTTLCGNVPRGEQLPTIKQFALVKGDDGIDYGNVSNDNVPSAKQA